jgi:NADP-dependent 3-hydroxy acid dehydrogenase YdfG
VRPLSIPLQGKVALITGASGGIGFTTARALAATGARLSLIARTPAKLTRARDQLLDAGFPPDQVIAIPTDMSDPDAAARAVSATQDQLGGIDILINAAGGAHLKPFHELPIAAIAEDVGANLMATLYTTRHALPALIASQGHIINVVSGLGKRGASSAAAFAAAKFGVQGFTESLRLDVARFGVRVTALSPAGAGVNTAFWDTADPKIRRDQMLAPERIAELILIILTTRANALIDDVTIRTS